MNKRIISGLIIGIVAGIIDVIPMILQKLSIDALLSAFFLWVVVGFMVSTSMIKISSILKGILIGFLCLFPSVFIIGWNNPISLIPISIMTLILGAFVGITFNKIVKE